MPSATFCPAHRLFPLRALRLQEPGVLHGKADLLPDGNEKRRLFGCDRRIRPEIENHPAHEPAPGGQRHTDDALQPFLQHELTPLFIQVLRHSP